MDYQVMHFDGRLVAEIELDDGRRGQDYSGRLLLLHLVKPMSHRTKWTLLEVRKVDAPGFPFGSVTRVSASNLQTLKTHLVDCGQARDWRALVRAGAAKNADLQALWAPVQIDLDLQGSSVHRRDLRVGEDGQRPSYWRLAALSEAAERLWDLDFVVGESTANVLDFFPGGLPHWTEAGISLAGAVIAAKYDYHATLVVAVDGAGEVYIRTADPSLDPGAPRRYEPRPLTKREQREIEQLRAVTATPAEVADWTARRRRTAEERRDG
jgi:hypothetical protein